jgi:peptide/nickel transport system substrate-binding protein
MRLTGWQWLATSLLLIVTAAAHAETRPQYGGTLRVIIRGSPASLDPLEMSGSMSGRNLIGFTFDTLVRTDASGRVRSALAESWQISPGDQRIQLHLRANVKFQDGSPLTAEIAAASLRKGTAAWNITATGDVVTIDSATPTAQLLQELALPRNAIAKRDSSTVSGTGPFHIVDWQAGKKLTLAANEDYWGGRPFIDQIEIEMGRSLRDQMNALESGRADLVEVAPEQIHRVGSQRYQLVRSNAIELVALKFAADTASAEQKNVREALRFSVERRSMQSVLLQGAGLPTGSLLPNWMTGYGFLFPTDADLGRAHQLRDQVPGLPTLTLGYDNDDPVERLLAERIALNAKDAGLAVQLNSAVNDLRLVGLPLASSDPWIALENLGVQLGLSPIKSKSHSVEDLFAAEQTALASGRVIPLFHLPIAYASTSGLRNWLIHTDGSLDLAKAWFKTQP